MPLLDDKLVLDALSRLGAAMDASSTSSRVRVVVAGGVAGLLGGLLSGNRTTGDVDVLWAGSEEGWRAIERAAAIVAADLSLPPRWFNRDCSQFAWCFPLEWESRCVHAGTFGRLEVWRIGRVDLLAAKLMGAPKRPQDLLDIQEIAPTREEIAILHEHLDRLESEHLGGETFERQRQILDAIVRPVERDRERGDV